MTKLAFIDTETTSLDDRTGEIWEIALILCDDVTFKDPEGNVFNKEYVWQLPVNDLSLADPFSLNIGRFHDRRWPEPKWAYVLGDSFNSEERVREIVCGEHYQKSDNHFQVPINQLEAWAAHFVSLTKDAHLIGNVVNFDEERLRKLVRSYGQCHMWHYHLVDVETLIAGRIGLEPPWKSTELSEALNIPVPEDQHSALADARWAMDMYDSIYGTVPNAWGDAVLEAILNNRKLKENK